MVLDELSVVPCGGGGKAIVESAGAMSIPENCYIACKTNWRKRHADKRRRVIYEINISGWHFPIYGLIII